MAHKELNLRERRVIEDMLKAKFPVREIAAQIVRHVSTIYREIKLSRQGKRGLGFQGERGDLGIERKPAAF